MRPLHSLFLSLLSLLLPGPGQAQTSDPSIWQLFHEHMELLDRAAAGARRTVPPRVEPRPPTVRPERVQASPSRAPESSRPEPPRPVPAPVRPPRHHASANASGPSTSRGPVHWNGQDFVGDVQPYRTRAMSRQMNTCRPYVLNDLIRIAGTLTATGTTLLAAEQLPGRPKSVTLGELLAFTRATGREAGIWWDPLRRKNIIGLGNSEPTQTAFGRTWTTPSPSASCFLIAHTHPRPTPPSDADFVAVGTNHRRAVAALKGWPRHPGTAAFRRFKSLLLPVSRDPMVFTVNRLDR